MTETATEIPVLKSEKEREDYQAWEEYARRRGEHISPMTIFHNILRGILPPPTDFTVDSEARRRDAVSGRSTVDFPVERKLSPIEQDIWRINRDTVLEATGDNAYKKPPGESVDFSELNWAEYGWAGADKRRAREVLMEAFRIDDSSSAERAAEALLLAGYTADEVINRINSQREFINNTENVRSLGSMGLFQRVFSYAGHTIHDSTAKIVFGQEAFEAQMHGYGGDPQTMEDLAWRLAWTGSRGGPSGMWMQGKDHAMFEARGKSETDANGIKRFKQGKYYVNENSFINWLREEMDSLYDIHGPNTPIQVLDQVQSRISNLNLIRLREMIEKQEAFKSEDGNTSYAQTWLKLQLEAATFQTLYDNDIIYRQSVVSLDKWMEQYEQMTFMNPLTKLGFRTNIIQQLLLGTNVYKEGRADVDSGKYLSDSKLGGAFSELVLAFYNLGDFDELQRVLGSDSSFFTREGWINAIKGVTNAKRPGGGIKLSPEERKAFDEAFDERTGKIKKGKEDKFIKFVNTLGTSNLPGSHLDLIVQQAIGDSVKERFDLGKASGFGLVVAQAWFFNRFMGGLARNDVNMTRYLDKKKRAFWTPNPSVHDKPSELFNMGANREKYASKGGGKPYGNLQTIGQFKASAIDPMSGIVTMEDVPVYDAYGNPVKDEKMRKSLLWVINEAHDLQVRQQERINAMKNAGISKEEIKKEENVQKRIYMHYVANNAAFHDNAHREYVQVHLKAAKEWTTRIMNGEGLDFKDFTNYDAWGGPTISRDVLSQKLQKKMLGLTRDMVKKYHWMNFNEDARIPYYNRKTGEYGFRDGKLGERMFGYDLLNRKEFWMTNEKGKYIKEKGLHVIDFNKVNSPEGRVTLMKQMFMTEVAGDIYSHQLVNSGDLRFNHVYYLTMLDVLKKTMPGKLIIDEFAKHGIKMPEEFLSDDDYKWLKARALNGNILGINAGAFGFYLKWVFTSLVDKTDKEGLGVGKTLGILLKAIISGH